MAPILLLESVSVQLNGKLELEKRGAYEDKTKNEGDRGRGESAGGEGLVAASGRPGL